MAQESPADTPEVEPASSPCGPRLPADLRWLPTDYRTGRMIDGRGRDAQAIKRRLEGYWLALTAGGKRDLTPQEVAGVRSVVALEYDLALALGAQAGGKRAGEDLTRLSSELRRTLADLGLQAPGATARPGDGRQAASEAVPEGDWVRKDDGPRVDLALRIESICGVLRGDIGASIEAPEDMREKWSGLVVTVEQLTPEEAASVRAICDRVGAEQAERKAAEQAEVQAKYKTASGTPTPAGKSPAEKAQEAENARLRALVEKLQGELKQARAEAKAEVPPDAPVRTRKVPRPTDPQLTPYSGDNLGSWARGNE